MEPAELNNPRRASTYLKTPRFAPSPTRLLPMTPRWLKSRLPKATECRERLGVHRWAGDRPAAQSECRWPTRVLFALLSCFDDPRAWAFNRRSIAGAVATGLFIAWMPVPGQMIIAACCAAMLRVHVPLSVVMVWFTNPLTVAPLGYVAWLTGSMVLGSPQPTARLETFGVERLMAVWNDSWPELLVGCLFAGAATAIIGYLGTLLLWRISTIRRWRGRNRRPA